MHMMIQLQKTKDFISDECLTWFSPRPSFHSSLQSLFSILILPFFFQTFRDDVRKYREQSNVRHHWVHRKNLKVSHSRPPTKLRWELFFSGGTAGKKVLPPPPHI